MAKKSTKADKTVLPALSADSYEQVFRDFVHFSFKTVNSNARPGGVRLAPEDAISGFHYVTARSLMGAGVPLMLDYTKNVAPIATAHRHLRIAHSTLDTVSLQDPELVMTLANKVATGRHEVGTDAVDVRLRQILLPKDKFHEQYLAVTPLVAGGLSRHLNQAVIRANQNRSEKQRRIRTAFVGIGGAKPMNASGLAQDMHSPLFFDAPAEKLELKEAYRLHYHGLKLLLPRDLMTAYFDWRLNQLLRGGGRMPSDADTRSKEAEYIHRMTRVTLKRAAAATEVLNASLELLPGQCMVDPELPLFQRGLLDPEQRTAAWRTEMAEQLTNRIASYRFKDDATYGFNQRGKSGIATLIEEMLG